METMKQVLIAELPAKKIEAVELYNSVKRGVKASLEPWKFAQDHPDLSGNFLEEAFDKEIESRTEKIMQVVINEIYL